jgi:EAL domain-containing protein (putative c-di-GMP-specific phosphodiesterase class I)
MADRGLSKSRTMRFPVLDDYLRHLSTATGEQHRIWLNAQGQAQGSYFNCALTSVFQPVRRPGTGEVVGYEAFVRSSSEDDAALSIWRLLEALPDAARH